MRHALIILSVVFTTSIAAAGYDRDAFYRAFMQSDLTPWHEYIAEHIDVAEDSLMLILDLEYNYLAWASSKKYDDNLLRLGAFNKHIKELETMMQQESVAFQTNNRTDLLTFKSASHVYAVSIYDKQTVTHSLQALTFANQACNKKPSARALMHQGFMYFYRPSYAGGNKEKALKYLRQAENIFKRQADATTNWNLRNTQMHIAQCLIKLGQIDDAKRYINNILKEEPNFEFLKTLLKEI